MMDGFRTHQRKAPYHGAHEAMAMQAIEAEVTQLCGKRGTVNKNGYQRWGTNPGSIVYGTERIQISVPRVRDTNTGQEVPLKTYQLLYQRDPKQIEKLTALLLSKATALLENLVHRGFSYADGILVIIDGSKGLRKAVQNVFGDQAVIQRCQWHKRENVVQHTKQKGEAERAKGRLQDAYDQPDYERAHKALVAIHDDLQPQQPRAAASLREGLNETLTVLRLQLHETLRRSFKTSNLIENLNSVITHRTRNVKRWRSTDQRHRWFEAIFMHYESRLSRILEPVHLKAMEAALSREVERRRQHAVLAFAHPPTN